MVKEQSIASIQQRMAYRPLETNNRRGFIDSDARSGRRCLRGIQSRFSNSKHLVMFLDVAYRKHNKAMTGVYRELFFKLVTQAARSENILAIELQQRAAGL